MSNKDVVKRFEDEFKNKENLGIVDEVMAPSFVHHAPIPGVPSGREGLKAIGQFIFGHIKDIVVKIELIAEEGELVADRISAHGVRKATGEAVTWTENHIYKVQNNKIVEWWGEGGPPLG
jgi:predicted SnoaL-like aldol condensation-catalyzing enzyme